MVLSTYDSILTYSREPREGLARDVPRTDRVKSERRLLTLYWWSGVVLSGPADSAQHVGISQLRVESAKTNRLIAAQNAAFVHRSALHDVELQVGFGADDEERQCTCEPRQSSKV
jgi:hypothetical protein